MPSNFTQRTATVKYFDYKKPQPEQIDLLDVVIGLANTCRYAAQCPTFYSVAEHSVRIFWERTDEVADVSLIPESEILACFLHDADEAYWGDTPAPRKGFKPDPYAIERYETKLCIMAHIEDEYGVKVDLISLPDWVKRIDKSIVEKEMPRLWGSSEPWSLLSQRDAGRLLASYIDPLINADLYSRHVELVGVW